MLSDISRPLKIKRTPEKSASPPEDIPSTPLDQIDAALEALNSKKDEWQTVGCEERASMLNQCLAALPPIAIEAASKATDAHGSYGSGIGEELLYVSLC